MTKINIKGRYTLREMDGRFYLYDRHLNGLSNKPFGYFTNYEKAKAEVLKL